MTPHKTLEKIAEDAFQDELEKLGIKSKVFRSGAHKLITDIKRRVMNWTPTSARRYMSGRLSKTRKMKTVASTLNK